MPLARCQEEVNQTLFSLPKRDEKSVGHGEKYQKEHIMAQTESRRNSVVSRDGGPLTGLFALLEAVNNIDKLPKEAQKHKKETHQVCKNKFCTSVRERATHDWSRRKINGEYVWLCERCSQAYNKKQYCEYCKQIYLDTSDKNAIVDGLDWMQCESCKRWTHVMCEKTGGCKDIDAYLLDPLFVYHCADCKKANPFGRKCLKKKTHQR